MYSTQVRVGETDITPVTPAQSLITVNCPGDEPKSHNSADPKSEIDFTCSVPILGRFVTAQKINANSQSWEVNEIEIFHDGESARFV